MKLIRLFVLGLCSVQVISCQHMTGTISNIPDSVKPGLVKAGTNKSELIRVIQHYSKSSEDSQKLKAAFFLIANMPPWHYYEGKRLDDYIAYITNIRSAQPEIQILSLDILDSLFGQLSFDKLKVKYDIQQIKADQLIDNIDLAFWQWKTRPWGRQYSFDVFCKYILPFKMGDGEPQYNRGAILDHYTNLLDFPDASRLDAVTACKLINTRLQKKPWRILLGTGILPHMPATKLIGYRIGSCRDQSDLGAYVMRSMGIPISLDFVPQWPTRSLGHEFTSVIDSTGKPVMFSAADENPGLCRFMTVPKGKVYRHTIEKNAKSLAMIKDEEEFVPAFLSDPYIEDVTNDYASCSDINVPLWRNGSANHYKHAYICLFNNKSWIPVDWGAIKNDTVRFCKLERNILYLPAYFDVNGIVPANYPFILTSEGKIKFLVPDRSRLIQSASFKRIFPILPHFLFQLSGNFQASNHPDFKQLTNLCIPWNDYKLEEFWNTKSIVSKDSFRYVRYFTPRQCIIGDMELYSKGCKLTGSIITSGAGLGEEDHFAKERAFDDDVGTSYISEGGDSEWIGLDFGHSVKIDSIRFSPGISIFGPRCYVVNGHIYEFQYWNKEKWTSIDTAPGKDGEVTFSSNIPIHGLYRIHDLTKAVNDRCFTIENGKQIWW